jgi:2-polyprenyl-6-methoxyphenol hydroxylase-like FAD-dependent oxidoreductase
LTCRSTTRLGPTPHEPYYAPLMVPQFLTEAVVRGRLAGRGHRPEFGRELTGSSQDAEGVTAQVGNEILRARYLAGTDGGRSFVRRVLGVDFPGATLGVRAIVADVELEGVGRDAWHRFNSDRGQILLCPLAGTSLFQVQGPMPLGGDVDLTAAGLTALVTERTGRDIVIHSVSWASAYEMNARLAERYRVGRVFLAGDAAHTHPPTGGQGLNTSVQDSYNLGWKLAAVLDGARETLLGTYEEERRPIAAGMLGMATRLLDEGKREQCGAVARRGNWTSDTPPHRWRCRRANAMGGRRAIGRRMRRCAARRDSRPASFHCSKDLTGHCSATTRTKPLLRRGPGCVFTSLARRAIWWMTAAISTMPMPCRRANGC